MAEEKGKNPKGAGQAEAVLKAVKTILKPNGCLAVLEFKKCDGLFQSSITGKFYTIRE